jgi:hypothetical protein
MKIAYLIMAHRNPRLLGKLVNFLSGEDTGFHIHIDQKSDLLQFSQIKGPNIHFCKTRVPVYWAEYSMIEAMLTLIREALESPMQYRYFMLLSGSDYPIQSRDYIRDFLSARDGSEFISMVEIPNEEAGIPLSRLQTLRMPSTHPVARLVVRGLAKFGFARRDHQKHLGALKPFGGSTWWTLTDQACQYILQFVGANPQVRRYFEKTFACDEMFIHTIIGNSPFKENVRRHLMFEDWPGETAGSGHPALITSDHVANFQKVGRVEMKDVFGQGEVLFSRKFNEDNLQVVQEIDNMIQKREYFGHCSC